MLGMRTDQRPGRDDAEFHFEWVFLATAIVFAGRLALSRAARRGRARIPPHRRRSRGSATAHRRAVLLVRGAPASSSPSSCRSCRSPTAMWSTSRTTVLIYVMLGWGLNIVVGLAGLLDLGYVAFYAVGAYSYALLAQTFGLGFWTCLPLAGLLAASFGMLLGFPVLRLRGDYLAIVTLGFGEIIRIVLLNWYEVTGGPNGISDIPRPSFFGLPFDAQRRPRGDRLPPVVRHRVLARAPDHLSLLPDPGCWRC